MSSLSLSLYTATSSRTQWGPGALAGKAILALGKATISSAERVVIFRRMATIRAHLSRCNDEHSGPGANTAFVEGLFDDLLELSRPELYPESVRHAAMELVLEHIGSMQTAHLINSLSRWLLDDLMLLMLEVMSVALFCQSGFLDPGLVGAYLSSTPPGRHPIIPAVAFIAELAQMNEIAFEAAILSRFLDFLVLTASSTHLRRRDVDVEDGRILARAFSALCVPPPEVADVWSTSLEQFWPFSYPPSLDDVVHHIRTTSPDVLLAIEAHFLQREAPRLLEVSTPQKYALHTGRTATDTIYPQMQNFTLTHHPLVLHFQEVIDAGAAATRALWHLMRCVALGGDVFVPMAEHLRHQSHRARVSLLSRIIYLALPNTRESQLSATRALVARIGGRHRLQSSFTNFLLILATLDEATKYALVDAVVTLLVPLLTPDMDPVAIHDDLFRRNNFFPSVKRRPTYSKKTLRLFSKIRENQLAGVIGEPHSDTSKSIAEVLEPIFNG